MVSADSIARDRASLRGTSVVTGSVWDSNSPIDANVLIGLALDAATHGDAPDGSEGRARNGTGNLLPWRNLELRGGFWLGGRDSNPDNVVQSHVSYR